MGIRRLTPQEQEILRTQFTQPRAEAAEEIAGTGTLDMQFLLNFIAIRHPAAYADARTALSEMAARNAAAKEQEERKSQ